jgi:hypothetical protein
MDFIDKLSSFLLDSNENKLYTLICIIDSNGLYNKNIYNRLVLHNIFVQI